jgi:hypothetical protein
LNKESCSLFNSLQIHILFRIVGAKEGIIWIVSISNQFEFGLKFESSSNLELQSTSAGRDCRAALYGIAWARPPRAPPGNPSLQEHQATLFFVLFLPSCELGITIGAAPKSWPPAACSAVYRPPPSCMQVCAWALMLFQPTASSESPRATCIRAFPHHRFSAPPPPKAH